MAENTPIKEQIKKLTDQIEAGIKALFQSGDLEKYQAYLRTMSHFHHYSVNNQMLIFSQCPHATLVAGYQKWQNQFSRHVMRGEKGISILAPTPYKIKVEKEKLDPDTKLPLLDADGNTITEEKEVQIPMFRPVKVFDVSQTDGKPLPERVQSPIAELTGNVEHYEAFMEALRRVSPVLDDTGQLLSAAALTVCKLHNIGDAAPIRLAPLELLNGLQEANELLLGAGEQITGVEAMSTADSLPDLPQLEQDYPMPDPTVDFAQMYQFGYTDGNTMLPLSKERARELFLQDVPIFALNSDSTEYMVLDTEDLGAHSGIFGVERTEWERIRDTLQPRRDIVAPKQPDAVSYLHDDTAKTQPENYLKNAEMAMEDDYGMIDGIINNGPKQTAAEQEERSSILAKLKVPVETTNRTEKHAPKRSAEKEL